MYHGFIRTVEGREEGGSMNRACREFAVVIRGGSCYGHGWLNWRMVFRFSFGLFSERQAIFRGRSLCYYYADNALLVKRIKTKGSYFSIEFSFFHGEVGSQFIVVSIVVNRIE